MVSDAERMARAGEYVLGRMSAPERERAERDLEIDAAFRLAVMEVAERMRHAHKSGDGAAEAAWAGLARRLAALPHMQGVDLPRSAASPLESAAEPEALATRRGAGLRRWAGRLRNALFRRGAAPEGVAILQTTTREAAAVVEVRRGASLRLLLLQDFSLRAEEQLSLWSQGDDGAYSRLAGFRPRPEIGLRGGRPVGAGFALARERISPFPSNRMRLPALAEGLLRPLCEGNGAPAPDDSGRVESPAAGRKGVPG